MGYDKQISLYNYISHYSKLSKREKEVLEVLKDLGPSTSWRILQKLGKTNPNYVRPRLTDLLKKEIILYGSGEKIIFPLVRKVKQIIEGGRKQWLWQAI